MTACCRAQEPAHGAMVQAQAPVEQIRHAYDLFSYFYGALVAPLERGPRLRGLAVADIRPNDDVLEVAVGPGATFVEILKRVDPGVTVRGVDLSPKMLAKTERRARAAGHHNFTLSTADARRLPFPDDTFDVLFNSYMLDLIPSDDMPGVLGEFRRVLKQGGRLVTVNLSKKDESSRTFYESVYSHLPPRWVPFLVGGCRPVLMEKLVQEAGFEEVHREFLPSILRSEIVAARKRLL